MTSTVAADGPNTNNAEGKKEPDDMPHLIGSRNWHLYRIL
uniref:Uncharacterized protein n=1 Tax=Arundo donax TaxID=35708 RepID=A0A0A9D4Q8_ARUDO